MYKNYLIKNFLWYLSVLSLAFTNNLNSYGQPPSEYVDFDYVPKNSGMLLTDRNYPDYTLETYLIIPCRKADSIPINYFHRYTLYGKGLTDPTLKDFNNLSNDDNEYLCQLAWKTKEKKYFDFLVKIALKDTLEKHKRERLIMTQCLCAYNTDTAKKVLLKLLNDRDKSIAVSSAIALVQLGEHNIGLEYISRHYSEANNPIEIYNALMQINTPEALKLLKKFAKEEPDPACSLDALAALSLLGYCDYAFEGFTMFAQSNNEHAREKAASCLAYYIGTPEAFDIIKSMQNDNDPYVQLEVQKILKNYTIQLKK